MLGHGRVPHTGLSNLRNRQFVPSVIQVRRECLDGRELVKVISTASGTAAWEGRSRRCSQLAGSESEQRGAQNQIKY